MIARESHEHLCESCGRFRAEFPECMPTTVCFGNGIGKDNVIYCDNYAEAARIAVADSAKGSENKKRGGD